MTERTSSLDVSRLGGAAIVRVPRHPARFADALLAAVDELISEGCAVLVVDLHDLETLPAAGVAAFRAAARAARVRNAWLRIIGNSPRVLEPLLTCADTDRLDVSDTSGRAGTAARPRARAGTASAAS